MIQLPCGHQINDAARVQCCGRAFSVKIEIKELKPKPLTRPGHKGQAVGVRFVRGKWESWLSRKYLGRYASQRAALAARANAVAQAERARRPGTQLELF